MASSTFFNLNMAIYDFFPPKESFGQVTPRPALFFCCQVAKILHKTNTGWNLAYCLNMAISEKKFLHFGATFLIKILCMNCTGKKICFQVARIHQKKKPVGSRFYKKIKSKDRSGPVIWVFKI